MIGVEGGWTHDALRPRDRRALSGQRVVLLALPKALLSLAAKGDRLYPRATRPKLTMDRVGHLSHPDWTIDPAR